MATTTLRIGGMTCGACTSSVEAGLDNVEGIRSVSVSLVMERAVVVHDVDKISAQQICDIVEDRGFEAEILSSNGSERPHLYADEADDVALIAKNHGISTTTLHIGGMTCGACTSAVEGAFKDVPGVASLSISLLSERAVIEHDAKTISPAKLAEMIEETGFDAEVLETKACDPLLEPPEARMHGSKKTVLSTIIAIDGMTCGACTSAVESGFQGREGVLQFSISLLAERAVILHEPDKLSVAQILEIVEERGFDAHLVSSQEGGHTGSTNSSIQLKIYGLPSPESAIELQAALKNIAGITSAVVSSQTCRASITHVPSKIGLRAIVEAIEKLGYNALVADSDDNNAQLESLAKTKEIQEWWRAFRFSLSFAIPVFLVSMFLPMFIPALDLGSLHWCGIWLGDVICLLLTIPVQFGIGRRFYVSAWKSLQHGSPTMDVLVVLGTSAAFFFSCAAMTVSMIIPPHTRPATTFDTSTMLITFISLGRFLENRAKGQTSQALSRLMSLAPSSATIYADPIAAVKAAEGWKSGADTNEKSSIDRRASTSPIDQRTIPSELIEVGDIVILKPGDKIPADGIVTQGESYVDESMVTGEAMPILKTPGLNLMAGTVNGTGRLDFKVTRAGRDTQLSQIVRLVQEAQTSRAPIQRMADIVAGYFVPIIITLGLATFVGWMALSHLLPDPPAIFTRHDSGGKIMVCVKLCIAVIVFACPCALGLATPTAVMVGTGVGAEQGILVKGGAALETATKIKHIVLDKTGTLTMGKMSISISDIHGDWATDSERENLWWTIVGLAESGSEHPIAKAISAGAKEQVGLSKDGMLDGLVKNFKAKVGKGLSATVELNSTQGRKQYEVLIGNASLLRSQKVHVPTSPEEEYNNSASRRGSQSAGITTIHVSIDAEYAGSIGLSDTLKASARSCVSALHNMGINTSLVTGDQAATAHHVASLVGILPENVHAGVLPSGKQAIIENLQSQYTSGRKKQIVAMVGDGINDSPALATANVGISLASGTDVAMEAADIVLMNPNQLMDIPASLHLSRTIFRRIKYNLLFSCLYNAIGLPIAMGFFLPWGITLPPLAAGAAMACSSVTVVVSSLLLKLWRRPAWMVDEERAIRDDLMSYRSRGFWERIRELRDVLILRRQQKRAEAERGTYVPLDNMETV
ncbi:hypothetical protein M433DRAFT_66060 [Acidomyces richmondensis BFW]|nr:MAG: hypothetical protein FE78DRAFT_146825 [Acidomyces sp. 'richmondensis']KYG46005.1 hypothetical protein M433DRAFT_66060 [Acidomyces richmondensis BFW]